MAEMLKAHTAAVEEEGLVSMLLKAAVFDGFYPLPMVTQLVLPFLAATEADRGSWLTHTSTLVS